ncbi:phosphatidate cytidylyltransferase [Microbispora corallina]|uniref:phosphatidate cytidylyltransferase n=1 Tax=Microbispora corallina TaxID=83302 RepID=UPI001EF31545|nr:phosphatidate cytidylyltransferase [Microbispora corallina]
MDGTAGDRNSAKSAAGASGNGHGPADAGDAAGPSAVPGGDRVSGSSGGSGGGSRTGRNLPAAVAVGVALGVVVIGSLYVVKLAFLAVVMAAVGLGVHELAKALATRGIRVPLVPLLAGLTAMVVGPYWGGTAFLVGAFAVTVMVLLTWRMFQGAEGYVRDATAALFIAVYPALLAGFVPLLLSPEDGPDRVIVFIAVTVCSDIGGYFAGILFGRHRMSPLISPKKTWEGFAGSALACVVGGSLLVHFLLDGGYWQGALIGAAGVVCATLGDLIESVIKRDLGIKDMGSLLPGHGGVMDRLDSLLFTLVPVWLLLTLLVPVH